MEREYPQKMFWLFVLTNFLFHFFYLSVPGIIFCIVGIWIKTFLYRLRVFYSDLAGKAEWAAWDYF